MTRSGSSEGSALLRSVNRSSSREPCVGFHTGRGKMDCPLEETSTTACMDPLKIYTEHIIAAKRV